MIDLTKFPSVLKRGFKENKITFPKDIDIEYEPVFAYRKITRNDFKNCVISKDDFKSYAELNKPKPRGITISSSYYSCSLNISYEEVKTLFKLPGEHKGIAAGYIRKENGPKLGPTQDKNHVDWWLYNNSTPEKDFKFLEGGNENA